MKGFAQGFMDFAIASTALVFSMSVVVIIVLALVAIPVAVIAVTGDLVGLWDVSL